MLGINKSINVYKKRDLELEKLEMKEKSVNKRRHR